MVATEPRITGILVPLLETKTCKPATLPSSQSRILKYDWTFSFSISNIVPSAFLNKPPAYRSFNISVWLFGRERYDWANVATETENNAAMIKDRKSTRLNSSHSQISYAVFCLKKKK